MKIAEVVYWINEREAMRRRKESGQPYPYSKDPVMAHTRFTNVRREDDKVTKYLANSWWRKEWSDDMPYRMTVARFVNYIPSLEEITHLDYVEDVLVGRLDNGDKAWGSAYTITTCGRPMGKEEYLCTHILPQVAALGPLPCSVQTLKACHNWLMQVDGLGSFLAAQIVADLKNTPGSPLANAPDWHTWSAHGPGSLKGLSWFYGRKIGTREYDDAIRTAWACIKPQLPVELQDLHMQDVQNVFCEVSKFARIRENRGVARNKY